MNKRATFTATTLRSILIVAVILTFLLAGAGFYFAYGWIKSYAATVNQSVVSAHNSSSPTTVTSTKDLQAFLQKEAAVPALVDKLYAPQATFLSQAIQDINTYAHLSNLTVSNVTSSTGSSSGTASPTTSSTSAAPGSAPTAPKTSIASGGSNSVTVTLSPPVPYTSLIKFMTYVEHNLPAMQIQGVDIQSIPGSPNNVQITSLTIGVTTR